MAKNQFVLMRQKRFAPFFMTQFLGAFNDNVFKNAIAVLIAFKLLAGDQGASNFWVNLAQGLFILPFFIFSATAGQLADKYDKAVLIRYVKILEIIIMMLAALAFYLQSVLMLVSILFLMGTQSTFFGPVKYAILPQHLKQSELLGGNGLVEMGTFVAILLGTIAGGILIELPEGREIVSLVVILIAIAGYLVCRGIPESPSNDPSIRINWNFFTETSSVIKQAKKNRIVYLSILAISWFWFYGAIILAQMPNFTKVNLGGDNQVFTLLLTMFSIGVAVGSLFCEKLSGRRIEVGLIPFGALGLTLFGVDLYFGGNHLANGSLMGYQQWLEIKSNYRILLDMLFIGVFGGFYIVPLYALVQQKSDHNVRAQMIAANNIINSGFIVVSAVMAMLLLGTGFSIPELFLITSIMNALVLIYIVRKIPEFLMRFIIWLLLHTMYRVKHQGLDNIPLEGAALLVCNHVSFVDPLIIAGYANRPVRFVMDHQIYKMPVLNFIFRTAKAIPIAPAKEDPQLKEKAFDEIEKALSRGELVMIFPEGKITYDGHLNPFKNGIMEILKRNPVAVIPMALQGLWGSFFSRKDGPAMKGRPRRFFSKIGLVAGGPIPANTVEPSSLQRHVRTLRGNLR